MDFFCDDTNFSSEGKALAGGGIFPQGNKKELRRVFRGKRRALTYNGRRVELCLRMQKRLLESDFWRQSLRVVLYMALRDEADTSLLLSEAWKSGRDVFLPRCRRDDAGMMDMLLCRGAGELETSGMGILEPRMEDYSRVLSAGELCSGAETLIVVPALAFDREGFRLGYGGGYYDRMLARARCSTVGLAFHELLVPRLPRDAWDRAVGAVCTEEELLCLQP